jgi:hypothetical protein
VVVALGLVTVVIAQVAVHVSPAFFSHRSKPGICTIEQVPLPSSQEQLYVPVVPPAARKLKLDAPNDRRTVVFGMVTIVARLGSAEAGPDAKAMANTATATNLKLAPDTACTKNPPKARYMT